MQCVHLSLLERVTCSLVKLRLSCLSLCHTAHCKPHTTAALIRSLQDAIVLGVYKSATARVRLNPVRAHSDLCMLLSMSGMSLVSCMGLRHLSA